ncbi:hypothetical protein LWI28_019760 [Acer negundo]|uniref:NAC domain-containing protein n=1 Tax=Acer negundo TaxID=4023 RepID=A0AAD5IWR9_ACENE|nr:hypothetical protein LWI28_019760 [Acer negundo]
MHCFLFFLVFFFGDMVIPVVNRFRPKPEELVYYLMEKRRDPAFTIPDIKDDNIYKYQPSELPGLFSSYQSDDDVWYFFCTLENKYGNSDRASRTAIGGSWKKTGKDHQVEARDSNKPIGIKKIFVFYKDREFRKENRTNWVMHEYSEIHEDHNSNKQGQVVLCRIERKPDKKRKASSSLDKESPDKGQPSVSLAYDSGNNVAQDISEVESHQPRNLHLPSSSDYDVADSNLTEVEPNLQPNLNIPYVTKNISPESPIHPQPGSSHSSCFSNGSNVWTPRSASEQEDDLASSRLVKVKSDQLQPNKHTSYVTTNGFPESESQLAPKRHKSSNGEDLVAKNISSEPLPEPEDIFSGLEPLNSGKRDAIDGLQSPISSVFGDDSIVWNTLLGTIVANIVVECHPSSHRRQLRLCRTSRPLCHNLFIGFVDELQGQRQHQHLPVFIFVFIATSTARWRRLWPSSHSDVVIHRRFGFHFRYIIYEAVDVTTKRGHR